MLTVDCVIKKLGLKLVAGGDGQDRIVTGGYASDLLSNVMGKAASGNLWVTMQGHQNIIAVAALSGLAAVILAGKVMPENETIAKADKEKIPLLTTELSAYEVVGRLYELGIKGQC